MQIFFPGKKKALPKKKIRLILSLLFSIWKNNKFEFIIYNLMPHMYNFSNLFSEGGIGHGWPVTLSAYSSGINAQPKLQVQGM